MNGKMFKSPGVVFSNEKQVEKLTLADGFRFVVLMRGEKPQVMEADGQGIYEIDFPMNLSGKWPIVVFTIDAAHQEAWLNLEPSRVDGIINSIPPHEMADESREAKLKRFLEWTWDKPDALDWLFLPNQHFNQHAPIQVIAAGGMDQVIKHLEEDFNQVAT